MLDDKRLAHGRRWFEYRCWESEESSDAELWHHTHQKIIILRKLKDGSEIDELEVGRMYRVKFADGFEYDVCDDELLESPADFERPDYVYKKPRKKTAKQLLALKQEADYIKKLEET